MSEEASLSRKKIIKKAYIKLPSSTKQFLFLYLSQFRLKNQRKNPKYLYQIP
jgi:hypothetical protein